MLNATIGTYTNIQRVTIFDKRFFINTKYLKNIVRKVKNAFTALLKYA